MEIWWEVDEAYDLMDEYDTLSHRYGTNALLQAEVHIINLIAQYSDITTTDVMCWCFIVVSISNNVKQNIFDDVLGVNFST